MSNTVIINRFDGGHADDIRTTETNKSEKSLNFDIFSNPHYLQPYTDSVQEVVTGQTTTDFQLSDVGFASVASSGNFIIALGQLSSGSANPTFFYKSAIADGFSIGGHGTGSVVNNSLVIYKGEAYCLGYGGGAVTLYKMNGLSTVATIGTISTSVIPLTKPFIHPEDNIMYIIVGNIIQTYDGTTWGSPASTILPNGYTVTSITNWGSYIAFGCQSNLGSENTRAYLWGRDASINTLQGVIDFGEGNLVALENINNVLTAIVVSSIFASSSIYYRLEARIWSGGAIETVSSLTVSSANSAQYRKVRYRNRLYFGLSSDESIYVFGKNSVGNYFMSKDHFIFNGVTIGSTIIGMNFLGDYLYIGFSSQSASGQFYRTTAGYTSTSIYKTTINPNMTVGDRYKDKQLVAVQIAYTGTSSGTIALKYAHDGSALVSAISESITSATESVKESTTEIDGDQFESGREYQFQAETTGGIKIKEIRYSYSVLPTQI